MCVTVLCFCLNLAWKWLIIPVNLTFTTLWFNSPDNKLIIFFLFFTDTYFIGFGIPCKLSPKETTCMKYWSLFLGKKKKNIIKLSSAEFSHKVVKVNLTLKAPRKTASENVVCLSSAEYSCRLFKQANSVDPDQKGAVWSGSTLFAEVTFKVTSRRQDRRQ